jgi:hypothetical protein
MSGESVFMAAVSVRLKAVVKMLAASCSGAFVADQTTALRSTGIVGRFARGCKAGAESNGRLFDPDQSAAAAPLWNGCHRPARWCRTARRKS